MKFFEIVLTAALKQRSKNANDESIHSHCFAFAFSIENDYDTKKNLNLDTKYAHNILYSKKGTRLETKKKLFFSVLILLRILFRFMYLKLDRRECIVAFPAQSATNNAMPYNKGCAKMCAIECTDAPNFFFLIKRKMIR